METNEVINNEIVEEAVDMVKNSGSYSCDSNIRWMFAGIGTTIIVGGISYAVGRFVVPAIGKIKDKIKDKKAEKYVDAVPVEVVDFNKDSEE